MRRREFAGVAATLIGSSFGSFPDRLWDPRPRPSPSQLTWQRDELALFLHFGVNTFSDREWGEGRVDPAIFNPAGLDARQWARAARADDAFCREQPVARGRGRRRTRAHRRVQARRTARRTLSLPVGSQRGGL